MRKLNWKCVKDSLHVKVNAPLCLLNKGINKRLLLEMDTTVHVLCNESASDDHIIVFLSAVCTRLRTNQWRETNTWLYCQYLKTEWETGGLFKMKKEGKMGHKVTKCSSYECSGERGRTPDLFFLTSASVSGLSPDSEVCFEDLFLLWTTMNKQVKV